MTTRNWRSWHEPEVHRRHAAVSARDGGGVMTAAVLSRPAQRVGPGLTMRNTATLTWRSLVQIKHNPMELLDLSVQPLMFVLLFTYVFGGAVAHSTSEYLRFALPGIIVQNALFATM